MRVFILFAIGFQIFFPSVHNSLIFDDSNQTINNLTVISGSFLDNIFSYRPVRTISYWIDYKLFGADPFGFRLMNIFYHALTTISVYCLFLLLGMRKNGAFIGALLFAIHPIHSDAVAYISGRRDLLTALFYVLSVGFFVKYYSPRSHDSLCHPQDSLPHSRNSLCHSREDGNPSSNQTRQNCVDLRLRGDDNHKNSKNQCHSQDSLPHSRDSLCHSREGGNPSPKKESRYLALAIIFMFLSFFSKETGATIPLVWLLYIYYKEGNTLFKKQWFYALTMIFVTIFSIFGIYAVQQGASSFIKGGNIRFHGDSIITHYLTALTLPVYYIRQTIFPLFLKIDNINYPLMTGLNFKVIFSIIAIISYAISSYIFIKKKSLNLKLTGFFMIFFAITLIPMLQIIPLHEIAAEHYLYLPSLGFCAVLGIIADANYRSKADYIMVTTLTIILSLSIFFVWRTITRNLEMKNFFTILHAEEKWGELSYRGYYTLAGEYMALGFPEKAEEYLKKSFETGYFDANSYVNKIQLLIRQGKIEEAIKEYGKLNQSVEKTNRMQLDIASAYFISGNCKKVMQIVENFPVYYNSDIADIKFMKNCEIDVEKEITQNCIDDFSDKYFCSSKVYAESGNFLKALVFINKSIEKHGEGKNLFLKAAILENLGKLKIGAIPVYEKIIKNGDLSKDELIQAHHTLAVLLIKSDIIKSINYFKLEKSLIIESKQQVPELLEKTIAVLEKYQHDILVEGKYYKLDF